MILRHFVTNLLEHYVPITISYRKVWQLLHLQK